MTRPGVDLDLVAGESVGLLVAGETAPTRSGPGAPPRGARCNR